MRRASSGAAAGSEARPVPLLRVGCKRELRNQQTAADVAQAPVHAPRLVGKDPAIEDAPEQPLRLAGAIAALRAHEHDEPRIDPADAAAFHVTSARVTLCSSAIIYVPAPGPIMTFL